MITLTSHIEMFFLTDTKDRRVLRCQEGKLSILERDLFQLFYKKDLHFQLEGYNYIYQNTLILHH